MAWAWVKGVLFAMLLALSQSRSIAQTPGGSQPAPDRLTAPSIHVHVTSWIGRRNHYEDVVGAEIELSGQGIDVVGSTDANGSCVFDNVAPGEYSITAKRVHGEVMTQVKRPFLKSDLPGLNSAGLSLSLREEADCPYRLGETTVKCLDSAIKQLVGDDAVDCGTGYVTRRSAVKGITKCVHKNLKSHRPFVARYRVPTIDSYHVRAFVGDSSRHVHALMYDSNGIWDYGDPVYVLVDDCNKAKTDLFSDSWAPVPCKQARQ
jgi:hypothetical protein